MIGNAAWYARGGSKLHVLYTIMHWPYTSMVLSYVLIGAAISPNLHPNRVILTLVAYFLGLGLSAHALNELHLSHWTKALGKRELAVLCSLPLGAAVVIGVYGMLELFAASGSIVTPLTVMTFIILETFFLFAYNTNAFNGTFHSDVWFAFSWAALPTLISYYVNALTITSEAVLIASAMAATASIEINLSRWCKDFRRRNPLTEMRFADGTRQRMNTRQLLARPEKSLKLIVVAVDLLAIGLIVHKLLS